MRLVVFDALREFEEQQRNTKLEEGKTQGQENVVDVDNELHVEKHKSNVSIDQHQEEGDEPEEIQTKDIPSEKIRYDKSRTEKSTHYRNNWKRLSKMAALKHRRRADLENGDELHVEKRKNVVSINQHQEEEVGDEPEEVRTEKNRHYRIKWKWVSKFAIPKHKKKNKDLEDGAKPVFVPSNVASRAIDPNWKKDSSGSMRAAESVGSRATIKKIRYSKRRGKFVSVSTGDAHAATETTL